MHCSACGAPIASGATFCSRCGTPASERVGRHKGPNPDGLVWAIVSIVIGGIGVTTGLIATLKNVVGLSEPLVLMFALVSMAIVGVSALGFVWLLVREYRREGEQLFHEAMAARNTGELGPASGSVVDVPSAETATTRAMHRER